MAGATVIAIEDTVGIILADRRKEKNMKRFGIVLLMLVLALFVVGPAFAGSLADEIQPVVMDFIAGILGLVFVIISFYVRKGVMALTTKLGWEEHDALILGGIQQGVDYAEEWSHRKTKDSGGGIVKTGAEKFERAVDKALEIIPFPVPREMIESAIVSNLGKARTAGLRVATEYVDGKLGSE